MALCQDLPGGERHASLPGGAFVTRKNPSDIAASVRQRLLNMAKGQGEDFQLGVKMNQDGRVKQTLFVFDSHQHKKMFPR